MNKAVVPILSRLRALQVDGRHVGGGARVIAAITDPAPLAAVMRELNETMLSRSLTFESSAGVQLTLEVSGRRVLRMTAANGVPGAEACLAAETLEDEHKDDLLKHLQGLAAAKSEIRVFSTPLGRGGDGVSVGLPVALLADLLLVDLNPMDDGAPAPEPVQLQMVVGGRSIRTVRSVQITPSEPPMVEPPVVDPPVAEPPMADPDPLVKAEKHRAGTPSQAGLAGFARSLGPLLMAWIAVGEGAGDDADGPEEMVSHLRGFLDDEADALQRQLDLVASEDEPACLMLGASLIEGNGVLCARRADALLLALVDGPAANAALRAWAALPD